MITKRIIFLMCVFSWAWAGSCFAKVYKLASQSESDAVKMRDPIMPGDSADDAKIEFSEDNGAAEKKPNGNKVSKKVRLSSKNSKRLPRKLPKQTKTLQGPEENPGQLKFSAYAIGGRLEKPRVDFTLEPLPLPTSEEPVQIDYKEKLREMSSQKELGL